MGRRATLVPPEHRPLALEDIVHPHGGYMYVQYRDNRYFGYMAHRNEGRRVAFKSKMFKVEEDAALWVLDRLNA